MSVKTNAQLFAERGDLWNCRPDEQFSTGCVTRDVRGPDGRWRRREVEYRVEGYDLPVTRYERPVLASARVQAQPRRKVVRKHGKAHRPPEYRSMVHAETPGRDPQAVPVVLTAEQLQLRAEQQAQVQARQDEALARIAERKAADAAEVRSILSRWL